MDNERRFLRLNHSTEDPYSLSDVDLLDSRSYPSNWPTLWDSSTNWESHDDRLGQCYVKGPKSFEKWRRVKQGTEKKKRRGKKTGTLSSCYPFPLFLVLPVSRLLKMVWSVLQRGLVRFFRLVKSRVHGWGSTLSLWLRCPRIRNPLSTEPPHITYVQNNLRTYTWRVKVKVGQKKRRNTRGNPFTSGRCITFVNYRQFTYCLFMVEYIFILMGI